MHQIYTVNLENWITREICWDMLRISTHVHTISNVIDYYVIKEQSKNQIAASVIWFDVCWRTTIEPFINSQLHASENITVHQVDDIVNNIMSVTDIFNEYFAEISSDKWFNDSCPDGCFDISYYKIWQLSQNRIYKASYLGVWEVWI